jgi:hypothetical protein
MRLIITTLVVALLPASWALALTTTTVSFQNGINGYTGTFDRYINDGTFSAASPVIPQTDGSAVQTAILNGYAQGSTPDAQGLIRFDNIFGNGTGLIPSGAFILDAQLQLVTEGGATGSATGQSNAATPTDISGSVGPFGVAALKVPFSSSTDYYADFLNPGDPFGGRGPYYTANSGAYSERPVSGFGTAAVGQIVSAPMTSIVQKWSDGTLTNNGVAVQAGFTGSSDDWQIHTTGYSTPEGRPKLSVTYTTDPVTVTSFQPGVGSYLDSDVMMARMVGGASPATTDGATITGDTGNFLDGADGSTAEQLALIKFSNMFGNGAGQADPNKTVAKAWLVLTTGETGSTNSRTNDPYDVDVMRRSWTTSSLYTDFGTTPGLQWADGDTTPTLDRHVGAAAGSEAWYDVTSYIEAVRNGATDNGLAIRARQTDGWSIMFNGSSDTSVRPRLVIASTSATGGSLLGDFNNDTFVDAGDYVTWKKNQGTNNALANDNGLGTPVGTAHYNLWRANFGNSGPGSPGPTPSMLLNYDLLGLPSSGPPATWDPNDAAVQNSSQAVEGITGLALSSGPGIVAAGLGNGFSANNWTNVNDGTGNPVTKANAIAVGDYFQFGLAVDATHEASLSTLDFTLRRSATNAPMNYELQYSLDGFATAGVPILLSGNSEFQYLGRTSGNSPDPNPILTDPDRYMTLDSGGRPNATLTPGDQITTFDLSVISALQSLTNQTVTFRLFGWGDGAAGAANSNTIAIARVNGPRFGGFISSLPGAGASLSAVPEPGSMLLIATIVFAFGVHTTRRR